MPLNEETKPKDSTKDRGSASFKHIISVNGKPLLCQIIQREEKPLL